MSQITVLVRKSDFAIPCDLCLSHGLNEAAMYHAWPNSSSMRASYDIHRLTSDCLAWNGMRLCASCAFLLYCAAF